MMLILLFLGCFVDQVSMMLITLPFFMPLVQRLGIDPIWFGVMFLICMQLGLLTPPFGLLLFTMKGVAPPSITMQQIYARERALHRVRRAGAGRRSSCFRRSPPGCRGVLGERAIAPVQPVLRLAGNLAHRRRRGVDLGLLGARDPGRMQIAPGALHRHAASAPVAGLGDRSARISSPVECSEGTSPR